MGKKTTNNILCENIAHCSNRVILSQKQYRLCVQALAEALYSSESFLIDEVYENFKKSILDDDSCANAMLFKHISNIKTFSYKHKCEAIAELIGMNEITKPGAHGKISLVRNKYNDSAYESFSKAIRNSKFSYVATFVQACEDIINGVSEFAILPIENSSDGRLFGFYSLLDRYDLRICGITEVDSDDHNASSLKLALVGKTLPKPINDNYVCDFEFSLILENSKKLNDLLAASTEFSAKPRKIDTLSLEYDNELYRYYFTFRLPCSEVYAFALYLFYEYPNYAPIGFYSVENNKK